MINRFVNDELQKEVVIRNITWAVLLEDVHGNVEDQTEVEALLQRNAEDLGDTIFKESGFSEGYPDGFAVHAYATSKPTPMVNPFKNQDKVDALSTFLSIPSSEIQYWTDGSMTLSDSDMVEYYATKGIRKYDQKIGRQNKFNIYKRN